MISWLKLHLSVEIPDGYVLITKVEYDEMQKLADKGNSWETIAWFKQETGISLSGHAENDDPLSVPEGARSL